MKPYCCGISMQFFEVDCTWRCGRCGYRECDERMEFLWGRRTGKKEEMHYQEWRQAQEPRWMTEEELRREAHMSAGLKSCKTCGREFNAKFDWSDECPQCFMASPRGQAWKARKEAEANGFGRADSWDDVRRERDKQHQQQQERAYGNRYNEQFNDFFGQGQRQERQGRDPWGKFAATEDKLDLALIKKLIMLCHPDKHGGSSLSNEVTKILLGMKEKLK